MTHSLPVLPICPAAEQQEEVCLSPSAVNELANESGKTDQDLGRADQPNPRPWNVVAAPSLTIFPPRREKQRTICVLGAPRGGTSMIAGILRKLGVVMGDDIDEANNEDRSFLAHGGCVRFSSNREEPRRRRAILPMRRSWCAVGTPNTTYGGGRIRNPVFIFITRDPGAIAQRERIEERVALRRRLLAYINIAADAYTSIAAFVAQRARPTLLVSYERALRAPLALGHAIADFVGVNPSPDYDSWLEEYVSPDRPDASITAQSHGSAAARQFSSTSAVQILMEESLRVRREGFGGGPASDEAGVAGNKLYTTAVAMLNNGEYREAQDRALAILNMHAQQIPALLDGPIVVLAEELAGGGVEPIYPDLVCGAYYVLGMSSLLLASGQQALIYLTVAEGMMRHRLLQQLPGSVLSEANFWMCLFHKGVAAKAIQRRLVVKEVTRAVSQAASENPPAELTLLGKAGLAEAQKRVMAEL
jgi:hypothetical protein